jgi:hypothetical protein
MEDSFLMLAPQLQDWLNSRIAFRKFILDTGTIFDQSLVPGGRLHELSCLGLRSCFCSCGLHGAEDAHVACATAEISVEAFLDLWQGWLRSFFEKVIGSQDHAGGADAALCSAVFQKAILNRMELLVDCETLDGRDLGVLSLQDRNQARVDEVPIHEYGAGSAFAFATTFFGPCKMQIFTKDVEKALHWRGFDSFVFIIDSQGDLRHLWLPGN